MALGTLGLIPAKGASQRIPRKNLAQLGGRTLIQRAVECAQGSNLCSRLIISTEDEEVARHASDLGIDVPFMRPASLARDPAGVIDVALHALDELEATGDIYDSLIILLPTCPFRSSSDVLAAYTLFCDSGRPCVMSVSEFDHTPFAAFECDDKLQLTPVFPQHIGKQSQEMPRAYRPNGAVHVLDVKDFRSKRTYFFEPLYAYIMPRDRSIDIDSELDLITARALLSLRPELDS